MISLTLVEAQLFRMLTGFFGAENVIPHMSVLAVCGGTLPQVPTATGPNELDRWARCNKCLFTIVDGQDAPRMVVEFFSGFRDSVDATEAEHQRFLPPILRAAGIRYVTISGHEFSEMTDPDSSLDLVSFLESKVLAERGSDEA